VSSGHPLLLILLEIENSGIIDPWQKRHKNAEECSHSARPSPAALKASPPASHACRTMHGVQLHLAGCSALNKPAPKSSFTRLTHTHIHEFNPTGLLVHLRRQYNPSGLPVRSQGCTYDPTGLPVRSQGCTLRQTPNQNSPLNLSPPSRVLYFMLYILQETARLSVCARQVRGSILQKFCRLVAYLCRVVSLRQ